MAQMFWLALGWTALALAVAGAALPLLPTVPFLLVAAFAFARSSERWHHWLINHPSFGPPIQDWQSEGAISRKSKIASIVTIVVVFAISLALGVGTTVLIIQAIVLTMVLCFIVSRPTPSSE